MTQSEKVELSGHVLDSGMLSRTLDDILELGGDYLIERFDVGKRPEDDSYARITVTAPDEVTLQSITQRLQTHGVNLVDPGEAVIKPVEQDGVFPIDFYSSTNLDTEVRVGERWIRVGNPEMDCGLVVDEAAGTVRTVPVSDVRAGERVVCGAQGVRVILPPKEQADESVFEFMNSVVSSEKPQALQVKQIAQHMRDVQGRRRADPVGLRPRGGPHRRGAGDVGADRRRVRRRALRRQRAGHPRHRVGDLRHVAGRGPVQGLRRRPRPRAPHPRDQPGPPLRLDRRRRWRPA